MSKLQKNGDDEESLLAHLLGAMDTTMLFEFLLGDVDVSSFVAQYPVRAQKDWSVRMMTTTGAMMMMTMIGAMMTA